MMKATSGKPADHSLIAAFRFAIRGILYAFRHERNIWVHLTIAMVVVVAGIILGLSSSEWVLVLLCMGLVFSAELVNTAIEKMVDLLSPEKQERAGRAKDLAAGAVLICAVVSAAAGMIIFLPHIINFK